MSEDLKDGEVQVIKPLQFLDGQVQAQEGAKKTKDEEVVSKLEMGLRERYG